MRVRWMWAAVAVSVATMGLGACSSSGEVSTCEGLQGLAAEVRSLQDLDVLTSGDGDLEGALDDLRDSWDEAYDAAQDEFGEELEALRSAADDLSASVTDGDGSLGSIVTAALGDVSDILQAWDALVTAVQERLSDCDLSVDPGS